MKIPEEKLARLTEIANSYASTTAEIGQMTVRAKILREEIMSIEMSLSDKHVAYKALMEEEKAIQEDLLEAFGPGSVDVETGEFTSNS